ncbi:unnamed protein product (macronuclear) [Paramecium tetraurelia]|uniref:Ferritin n=1 Tax=Paramecium tetraurelia TaxID=5888 RepID=A0CYK8_PARTE|nr:uncharacterized protein GSPATT00011476001 [Paramecium tetraurelia]CAK75875.1 unnamed protein product [Paramecium tetraurelia]|eukprot:XP_001443272.1 hypothetical protein (macronuclear) [Paramecium tetraurelia strain d4-2]
MKKLAELTNKEIINLLSRQAHVELQSSFLYLQYAYWFDNNNFEGIGKFFKAESEEERKHSVQIFDYLNVRGVQVAIDPQQAAFSNLKTHFEKPGEYFEAYLAREHLNYSLLDQIGKQAQQTEEILTHKFIGSMLEDQASSVDEAEKLYAKAQAYSAFPGLFYHLDAQIEKGSQSFDTWRAKQS